jgi:hypothetical protein
MSIITTPCIVSMLVAPAYAYALNLVHKTYVKVEDHSNHDGDNAIVGGWTTPHKPTQDENIIAQNALSKMPSFSFIECVSVSHQVTAGITYLLDIKAKHGNDIVELSITYWVPAGSNDGVIIRYKVIGDAVYPGMTIWEGSNNFTIKQAQNAISQIKGTWKLQNVVKTFYQSGVQNPILNIDAIVSNENNTMYDCKMASYLLNGTLINFALAPYPDIIGGFSVPRLPTIEDEIMARKAIRAFSTSRLGVQYSLRKLFSVATQVVKGVNYKFDVLVSSRPITKPSSFFYPVQSNLILVYYVDLNGKGTVVSVSESN